MGREIVDVHTADAEGKIANAPMTWGVVVNKKDGLAYVNDLNNGLWVVRIEPRQQITPYLSAIRSPLSGGRTAAGAAKRPCGPLTGWDRVAGARGASHPMQSTPPLARSAAGATP